MKFHHFKLMAGIPELDERGFQPRGRFAGMCLYGKDSGGGQPQPDPAVGRAAEANVELGKQWLAFTKDQFAEGNKRQVATDELNTKVINQQLATQDQANTWAQEDRARTKSTFQPLEDQFVKTAQEYSSPAKQEQAAAEAGAGVQQQADVARQTNARTMASMGVNPNSGRFAGVERSTDLNTALATAGSENGARQMIRDKGLALTADAVNMGKGLASSTAAAYGIGTNAGNSAVANNASGNANFYANNGVMTSGYQGNINANNSAGTMLSNLYGSQLNAWSAQQQANATSSAGIGSMIGSLAGAGATLY